MQRYIDMSNEDFNRLIADANIAFAGGNFETALQLAEKTISQDPKRNEGYLLAGKSCMSLAQYEKAAEYFGKLANMNKGDGNAEFLLGYALASWGKSAEALKNLTLAIENDCSDDLKGQIYKIIAMINIGTQNYNDALANLQQAQEYIGADYMLLQHQATCYISLSDYRNAIASTNQMKLLHPSQYAAYSIAFHIFMDLSLYDEAKSELERAEKFAEKTLDYYNDCMLYELMHHPENDTPETLPARFDRTLQALQKALELGKPTVEQVFEMYLRAAELHLSKEKPDEAIACLNAADEPVSAYNRQFSVCHPLGREQDASDSDMYAMSEEEQENLFEYIDDQINNLGVTTPEEADEIVSSIIEEYMTPMDKVPVPDAEPVYRLEGEYTPDQMHKDLQCTFYITAYEMKKDYDTMLIKARELQGSNIRADQYNGIYYELKIGKYKNAQGWKKKYEDRIRFWSKKIIEDSSDFVSAGYRIRCYIDIGDYAEAERLCEYVPSDVRKTLMEEIEKAKGGESVGSTSG